MTVGRPTDYSRELAEKIATYIAKGGTLIELDADPKYPSRDTIWRWEKLYPEFSDMMREAHPKRLAAWAEECKQIADEREFDFGIDDDGKPITNYEHIQRAKLRIDTRLKIIGLVTQRIGMNLDPKGDDGELDTEGGFQVIIESKQLPQSTDDSSS